MIRLDPTNAQRTIELLPGVRVTVLPLTSAIWIAAGADQEVRPAGEHPAALTLQVVKAVARRVIVAWEGVGDLDGNVIEPLPAHIDLLFDNWRVYQAFNEKYVGPYMDLSAEGNASATSRTGNSGVASSTAKTAKKPALTARSSNTRRKP